MKKVMITIASLAALSTAAFAGSPGNGVDTDAPRFYSNMKVGSLHPVSKKLITKFALSHKNIMRVVAVPNYINMSQLR